MSPSPQKILNEIAEARQNLANKEAELAAIQARCNHSWGSVSCVPSRKISVSDKIKELFGRASWDITLTEPEWTRQCNFCLKVERTTRSKFRPVPLEPDFEPEKPLTEQQKKFKEIERMPQNSNSLAYDMDPDVFHDGGRMT